MYETETVTLTDAERSALLALTDCEVHGHSNSDLGQAVREFHEVLRKSLTADPAQVDPHTRCLAWEWMSKHCIVCGQRKASSKYDTCGNMGCCAATAEKRP